jgi:3-hydroxyacyl-[acyl-carrier-protein] dehydratase
MIDRILDWEIGGIARAVKNISLSEDFFDDHFPRMPIMPGVLILEGMAQLGGVFLEETAKQELSIHRKAVMISIDKTKFREISVPGDTLIYSARILAVNDAGGKVELQAEKCGKSIVKTMMNFAFREISDPYLLRDRDRLLKLWMTGHVE